MADFSHVDSASIRSILENGTSSSVDLGLAIVDSEQDYADDLANPNIDDWSMGAREKAIVSCRAAFDAGDVREALAELRNFWLS